MQFSSQEYWGGLSYPPPGNLPDQGFEPRPLVAPALQVDSLPLSYQGSPFNPLNHPLFGRRFYDIQLRR